MIVRIDDRLRDPNIVSSWANYLKVDKLIVLNDKLSRLKLEKELIKIELDKKIRARFLSHTDIENGASIDEDENSLLFVSSVKDLIFIMKKGINIDLIALGQKEFQKGLIALSEDFYVNEDDIKFFQEMTKRGKDILIQENPYSSIKTLNTLFTV